jgi:hypothetical protein
MFVLAKTGPMKIRPIKTAFQQIFNNIQSNELLGHSQDLIGS